MKHVGMLLLAGLLASAAPAHAEDDTRLIQSREYADALQAALSKRLQAAMVEDGPVAAIEVCRVEAPAIAARIGGDAPVRVGRTALRVRNPANAPDEEATAVLRSFEARLRADASAPLEWFEAKPDGSARYLRAIVLQPMCAVCHGVEIAPPVASAIAANYPDDHATGFAPGELRGAFVVDWDAGES
jgi:hypothetical protein